jgi:hypothetical protein
VELGTHAKCGVEGVRTIRSQLESRGSLEVVDVLYVLEIKMNFLSVSTMEDNGYAISFETWLGSYSIEGIWHRLSTSS